MWVVLEGLRPGSFRYMLQLPRKNIFELRAPFVVSRWLANTSRIMPVVHSPKLPFGHEIGM